jgi:glycosyltransferase involved in cell wall biosynthesis
MAAAFEQERGIPHLALMNSVNPELFDCQHKARGRSVVFVYAGGLHLGRWEALKSLEGAIARAAARNDVICQLRVYTTSDSEQHASSFSPETTEFLPPIPARDIQDAYEGADVLVHVESLDTSWLGFIRYSISTKIPEYLACGRPLLFFGPQAMGLSHHLKSEGIGFVANSEEELDDALDAILGDETLSDSVAARGRRFAMAHHSQSMGLETLRKVVSLSLGRNRGGGA